jgi:glycosyltransferase involved in cell wall biosynthesis
MAAGADGIAAVVRDQMVAQAGPALPEVVAGNGTPAAADGEPLRITMVAPPWFELPPRGYGGTEAVVAALVDQLVLRGHTITLIGAGPHRTAAQRFIPVFEVPPTSDLGLSPMPEVIQAAAADSVIRSCEADIVHDHTLVGPLLARGRSMPTVITMHGPVDGYQGDYYSRLGQSIGIVAISASQRRLNPNLHWAGTVHNAVDVASFPFRAKKEDYLLWLGRFCADKGAHLAIETARAAGRRIVLAGKLNEQAERDYFDSEVRPHLGPGIEYVGEADAEAKRDLLSGASGLLFPIQWEEPFGIVMIEAMACGTPVVALRRGSVPEVIDDGRTGVVVDHPGALVDALDRIESIDPHACRREAEERFDLPVMAARYEQTYRRVLARSRANSSLSTAAWLAQEREGLVEAPHGMSRPARSACAHAVR